MYPTNWHEHPTWRIIEHAMRREWRFASQWLFGGIFVFMVVGVTMGGWVIAFAFAGIMVCLSCLYYHFGRGHYRHSRLWEIMRLKSTSITWVYSVALQRIPLGFFVSQDIRITIADKTGKKHDLLVREHEYRAVMVLLERIAPQAVFGWTQERETTYDMNPSGLKRDQGSSAL